MTKINIAIAGRIDIHKGEIVCFIPSSEWIKLDNPPTAEMWTDRTNRIWAGMQANDLITADFSVEVPLRDLRHIEWTETGNGWVQSLIPMVFEDGLHQTLALRQELAITETPEPASQGPEP